MTFGLWPIPSPALTGDDARKVAEEARVALEYRGGVDDLIWEADKYPSRRHVRYDFSTMPLARGIVV